MIPYIICFLASCITCYFAEKKLNKNHLKSFYILSVITILLPAFLAGCRDFSVGTDILTYGNYVFNNAVKSNNFLSYIIMQDKIGIDLLYSALNFLVSRFTSNPHIMYLVIELIIVIFIYLGIYDNRDKISMWLGLLVFYSLFYGETLNTFRQSLSMAIIFWGTRFIFKKKFLKYFFVVFIASFFHNVAILSIFFYFIYLLLEINNSKFTQIAIVGVTTIVTFYYDKIASIFINLGLLSEKFERYIDIGEISFILNPFLIRMPVIILILIFYRIYIQKNKIGRWLITMLIIEIILAQLRSVSPAVYRISLYFACIKIIAYPSLCKCLTKNKVLVEIIMFLYLIIVWYYQTVVVGNNGIFPYTSSIMGF